MFVYGSQIPVHYLATNLVTRLGKWFERSAVACGNEVIISCGWLICLATWHVRHSSLETYDFGKQVLGHGCLLYKGWEDCWEVGRHTMRGQIFDY